MRLSSVLVVSVFSLVTSSSAWIYCASPLGCMPSIPSYGSQPQYGVLAVSPPLYVGPPYNALPHLVADGIEVIRPLLAGRLWR
jgi:hypothetical protein